MWNKSVQVGDRTIELETGRIAKQAHGAVLLKEGKTVILATVVYAPESERDYDFLPLTVDYREYFSAIGRIPGSFHRREGRGSDREVLSSRLCDRTLRPLFPKAYRLETQVITTVLSYDPASDSPVLAMIAAAAALNLSEIPWNGPVAALRVGRVDGDLTALPTREQLESSELDLIVSASRDGVVMIEGGAKQVSDEEVLAAIEFAQQQINPLLDAMDEMRKAVGVEKAAAPQEPPAPSFADALQQAGTEVLSPALEEPEKLARRTGVKAAKAQVMTTLMDAAGDDEEKQREVSSRAPQLLDKLEATLLRRSVTENQIRVDGRKPDQIRPIACEVDWLPGPHGSALFTRGETQAMVSLTLGSLQDRQRVESVLGVVHERFLLHYNFPPYSVGEVRPLRGPARREVGHGALARRALEPVLPTEADFPYTIRVLSEITESNGSSSMATVCGGCLSLMDGGVPITAPVAGIAMGMVKEGDKIVVLSDILGDEDHLGDMDFKVAGTEAGITAIQMDNKIGSLPQEVMAQAFQQAREGRQHILGEMQKAITNPREGLKDNAPSHCQVKINPTRVRDLIGPGGKVIQEIQRSTGARMEVNDEGLVNIYAPNRESLDQTRDRVQEIAGTLEVGAVFEGEVTGVKEFGAFVRVRGQEGLVHISEWDTMRVDTMSDVANEGDVVKVKVLEPDKAGRLSLSRKAAL